MEKWLARYRRGERVQVWEEIRALGPRCREREYDDEVARVVAETMARVRINVDRLVAGLREEGYEFVAPTAADYHTDRSRFYPSGAVEDLIAFLEALRGPLPLVMTAWMRQVGDVNLVGNHPLWPRADMYTDALVVEFEYGAWDMTAAEVRAHYRSELEAWQWWAEEAGLEAAGGFCLPFAPDVYHKVNVSGGGPYGIYLPDGAADGLVEVEGGQMYFVDYLRHCFKWGGFPGFETMEAGNDRGVVRRLAEGLLEI